MIADLKPYPEYKESGLLWLGKVPNTWKVVRNGSLFSQRNQTGYEELPILEVSLKTGVRVRNFESSTRKQVMSDRGKYKRAAKNDIAYNMMRMWQGAVGVSPVDGLVSPAYVVARPYPQVEPRFFVTLFRTGDYMSEIDSCSHGIVKDRNRLYWDQFKQILSPCPPSDEQAAIVRFLDWANGRMERAIRAKRKVIALLNEQKQAIIHRAVTRGLDPSVPLKPSGIPWLGDIPQHWEVWSFVRCTIERADYRGATPEKVESGVFLVTAKNIRKGWIDYESSKEYVRASEYSKIMRRGLPLLGDVLLTMEAPLGHFALIDREDIALAQRIVRFRLHSERLLPQFALLCLNSHYFQNQLHERATGSTAQGIKASKLPQLIVACPSVSEQVKIVERVRHECDPLDTVISRLEREIELLREYRTRLVADVVTGKLDVREVAVQLPDEAPSDTVEEETELSDETEAEEVTT
jgi:type I restriction enzyme, S subunit